MNTEQVEESNDVGLVYTIDEALSVVGFGKFQALVLSYAAFGLMAESMELMILSFIGPSVRHDWDLSSGQESLISTAVFAGMVVGAYLWGVMSDVYGRRMGLLIVALVTSVSAFFCAFSPNYISLVLFRMGVGIGVGGGHVYSSWFLEFVPVHNRGVWMAVKATSGTVGTILEASLAWIVLPRLGWRWLLALSSLPCFAAFFFYFLTVESPRYLYLNGNIAGAHQILKKMASFNKTALPPGKLVSGRNNVLDEESYLTTDTAPLLLTRKTKTASRIPGLSRLFPLLTPSTIQTSLLTWIIYSANAFLYYGVVLLTSELSSGETKCRRAGSMSNETAKSDLYKNVFIASLAEVPGIILSAILLDKIGRRLSILVMYAFSFAVFLPLMFGQNEGLTTWLLFGARMFVIANYTVAGVYCPEVYPTYIRNTGVGVATAVAKFFSMISPFVAVGLVSGCQQMAAVGVFEVVIMFAGISVFFFAVETKGRGLNDSDISAYN